MPNWCNNELRVSGPKKDIARFKQQAVGFSPWPGPPKQETPSLLNFHSLVSIPADILKVEYAKSGHDWEVKNWGARWGACDVVVVDEDDEYILYHFDTAWSPAVEFIRNVRLKWPTLAFILDYDEPGMSFKGICKGHGEQFENHCIEY